MRINEADNVEIDISDGQKYAACDIRKGEKIIKYGHSIGTATRDIARGEHVGAADIRSSLNGTCTWSYEPASTSSVGTRKGSFSGFLRRDGRAGIRNEIWIVPTVGCINGIARRLAASVGGKALTHPYGCSQLGDDLERTRRVLAALIRHPNAGGVLVLGLGCENDLISGVRAAVEEYGGDYDRERILYLNIQDCGDEIEEGKRLLSRLSRAVAGDVRQKLGLEQLCIGVKCGGSDGYSGITANPLIGRTSQLFGEYGASVLMSEVPEMFGAETELLARCKSKAVFDDAARMINNFRSYYIEHGERISENPSPGNIAGGISTLEEKSLGCIQKGGRLPVTGVCGIGTAARGDGLWLVDGPGNDMVAVTDLVASGAVMILFSTGRGTPLSAPVPTLKISTNSALALKKPHWIDYDAGRLAGGGEWESCTSELFSLCVRVADGEVCTRGEDNGYSDIAIFKTGVTL